MTTESFLISPSLLVLNSHLLRFWFAGCKWLVELDVFQIQSLLIRNQKSFETSAVFNVVDYELDETLTERVEQPEVIVVTPVVVADRDAFDGSREFICKRHHCLLKLLDAHWHLTWGKLDVERLFHEAPMHNLHDRF